MGRGGDLTDQEKSFVLSKVIPTQQRWVVDMWSLYQSVEGTAYLAYAFQNWFSRSSFAGLDHVQEPCSAMDCWNDAWINWVGKMGVSSEVGDSIWLFLQVFDSRVGVVCCTFICYLCCTGVRTCIEAVTLRRASTDRKDVWGRQNMEESYFIIVIRSFGELSKCRRQIGGKSLRQRRNNPYLLHEDSTELQANGKKGASVRLQQTWRIRHKLDE